MWVNSVLPADMSLKNLDDALAAPLVVPLFVQVCCLPSKAKNPNHQSSNAHSECPVQGVRNEIRSDICPARNAQVLAGCQIEGLLKDPSPWSLST